MNKTAKIVIGSILTIVLLTGAYLFHEKQKKEQLIRGFTYGCQAALIASLELSNEQQIQWAKSICYENAISFSEKVK